MRLRLATSEPQAACSGRSTPREGVGAAQELAGTVGAAAGLFVHVKASKDVEGAVGPDGFSCVPGERLTGVPGVELEFAANSLE